MIKGERFKMIKYLYHLSAMILTGFFLNGCASAPDQMSPREQKVVEIYNSKYNSVPGSSVVDTEEIRTNGVLERYYNGRYIDPNTGDMYSKGTVYRVVESPHWNTVPNPDLKPYEINEAYKNIKNIANAVPLYAELDNKYQNTKDLNKTLNMQLQILRNTKEQMTQQNKALLTASDKLSLLKQQNLLLKQQIAEMKNQFLMSKTTENMIFPNTEQNRGTETAVEKES